MEARSEIMLGPLPACPAPRTFGNTETVGVSPEIIGDISGCLNKSETSVRYTNVAGLPLIREKISLYPKITEHLEPRPLQLLPWVENRQPAPWTQMTQDKRLEHARAVRADMAAERKRKRLVHLNWRADGSDR